MDSKETPSRLPRLTASRSSHRMSDDALMRRSGGGYLSRTPDVRTVMEARAELKLQLEPEVARGGVTVWPNRARASHTSADANSVADFGKASHVHNTIAKQVDQDVKSLRLAFPGLASDVPPVQWSRPSDGSDHLDIDGVASETMTSALFHGTGGAAMPLYGTATAMVGTYDPHSSRDPVCTPGPDASRRLLNCVGVRRASMCAAVKATLVKDGFSELEDLAIARLEIVRRALVSFSSVFKSHASFFDMVVSEMDRYGGAMFAIQQKRAEYVSKSLEEAAQDRLRFQAAEASMKAVITDLDARLKEANAQLTVLATKDAGGERRAMMLDALLAEKMAALEERDRVNAIQTWRLLEAEKKVEALQVELAVSASNTIALHRQLGMRQQLIDKLNFSSEQLYQERASLQRQLVHYAKRSTEDHTTVGSPDPVATGSVPSALLASLEACYDAQLRHIERTMTLSIDSFSESFKRGYLTPRPAPQQMEVEGNAGLSSTAARFVDMQQRVKRTTTELVELRKELHEALHLHEAVVSDRIHRFSVCGALQLLGQAHLPPVTDVLHSGPKWFLTMGDGATVPEHLRAQPGKVRNLKLSRVLVLNHAVNFLRHLSGRYSGSYLSDVGANGPWFCTQLNDWLHEAIAAEDLVAFAYSFHEGLRCFAYECRCAYVYELLQGTVSFAVWTYVDDWVTRVRDALLRSTRDADAKLTKKSALAVIERSFSSLPDDEISRVMAAVTKDHAGDGVNAASLFHVDLRGNEKLLPQVIREVLLRDRQTLVRDVESAILDQSTTSGGTVSPHTVASALMAVDPRRPASHVEMALMHVFGDTMRQTIDVADPETPMKDRFVFCGESVSLQTALQRLRQILCGRWSKRAAVAAASGAAV